MNISDYLLDVADWRKVQSVEHIRTMLSCVCKAISNAQAAQTAVLERIAAALEAGRGEPEVAPKAMRSLPVDPDATIEGATIEGAYVRKPSIDLNMGLYGFGGVYRDEQRGSWFAMELDPEFKADSPEDLRDVAALFRDDYADALEWIADEWQEQLDAGEVHLLEPDNDDDIADEDNELEDALFRDDYADALEWIADEWQEQLDAGEVHLLEPDNDDDIADEDNELEDEQ